MTLFLSTGLPGRKVQDEVKVEVEAQTKAKVEVGFAPVGTVEAEVERRSAQAS